MTPWPPGIFVVGTDTGVGKTRVASAIARTWMMLGHRVGVIKPVSTGAESVDGKLRSGDVDALIRAITTEGSPYPPPPLDRVGPIVYPLPLAPPLAARKEGTPLEPSDVIRVTESSIEWWSQVGKAELVVIEGVGGLLCPLAERGWTVADLAIHLDYPLLIVAHRGLGTLNHTLLTVEAARSRGLRVAGVVLNAVRPPENPLAEESNAGELADRLSSTAILADWPFHPTPDKKPVAPEAGNWVDLAQTPRVRLGGGPADPNTNVLIAQSRLVGSDDAITADPTIEGLGKSSSSSDSLRLPPAGKKPEPTSATDLSTLNLNLESQTGTVQPSGSTGDAMLEQEPRSPWRNVLLMSYASAVTLALLWTLYQRRSDRRAISAPPLVRNDRLTDSGRLADRSRQVKAAEPIPDDRIVGLGQTIRVDSLQIQPLTVERGNLTLQRINMAGKTERRDGGKRSIILRVRLQNLSSDEVFAPVDPAFVRVHEKDVILTFLETDNGRKVYPNSLAVDSEWSMVGESFADLRPGESREVIFATETNAPADVERMAGTWRIKLRTGLESTAVVGVRLTQGANP